ncbi:nucleotidyltransferase [Nocardioides rotundus]|uniref:nucleotidyltransferase domain-containing protein n=1 Tax=Nocardioides rotundus TaxID=1774216 RepID=UPI001CBEED05|nr:nucleotidyltransferase [Nocardioides rotundus]UAL29529.1 nucleotidyltransferase [Nocardioides rotundus]
MTTSTATSLLRTVVDAFTPSVDARQSVSAHRSIIEPHLLAQGVASHLFETGSWSHGTAVLGYSDVDYFAVMPRSIDQSTLALEALARSIDMLPSATAQIDRPTVRVTFADNSPPLEIVPAIAATAVDEFEIPDPGQDYGWVRSAPSKHFAYVDQARDRNYVAKALIRAIKIWRYRNEVPASSFYLEMRAARQVLRDPEERGLTEHLVQFFRDLARDNCADVNDPSQFDGPRISICGPSDLARVRSAVLLAAVYMGVASAFEQQDDESGLKVIGHCLMELFALE